MYSFSFLFILTEIKKQEEDFHFYDFNRIDFNSDRAIGRMQH